MVVNYTIMFHYLYYKKNGCQLYYNVSVFALQEEWSSTILCFSICITRRMVVNYTIMFQYLHYKKNGRQLYYNVSLFVLQEEWLSTIL